MRRPLTSILAVACLLTSVPAWSETESAPKGQLPPPLAKMEEKTKALLDGKDEKQIAQFSLIRSKYGVIRAVQTVRGSLERAADSCSKENPALKAEMTAAMDSWKGAVNPVIDQARDRVDELVQAQSIARPSELREFLKLFDQAADYRSQLIKEVPISSEEECKGLLKKMGKTQGELVSLLKKELSLDRPSPPKGAPAKKDL